MPNKTRRVGPQMQRALDYIREHPGCSQLAAQRAITRSTRCHTAGHNTDRVIKRLVWAGLVRAEYGPGNRYRLYADKEG